MPPIIPVDRIRKKIAQRTTCRDVVPAGHAAVFRSQRDPYSYQIAEKFIRPFAGNGPDRTLKNAPDIVVDYDGFQRIRDTPQRRGGSGIGIDGGPCRYLPVIPGQCGSAGIPVKLVSPGNGVDVTCELSVFRGTIQLKAIGQIIDNGLHSNIFRRSRKGRFFC